jgi:hypothetical protein
VATSGLRGEDPRYTVPAQKWYRSHPAVVARETQVRDILLALQEAGEDIRFTPEGMTRTAEIWKALDVTQGHVPCMTDWPGWAEDMDP